MNVLIIGSGGREHAIAKAVSRSALLDTLVVIPGNPGISKIAKCVSIDPFNNDLIKEFCIKQKIDLIIPGSEVYLENGIQDAFVDTDIFVFGPSKNAARIESSKEYAKDLMKKYHIPTASYEVFDEYDKAMAYVKEKGAPLVMKYDGLAGGKGVVVGLDLEMIEEALEKMLLKKVYGDSKVVIEEYLEGPEFSLMMFVHDDLCIPMPIAQDHKRLLDGDLGPNTGGMGIYSGVPIIDNEVVEESISTIMKPVIKALKKEGNAFTGFLYGGLMLTKDGPKVIEFNARFGDPEAEVVLPKLHGDILDIIMKLKNKEVVEPIWDEEIYLGVCLVSSGYPNKYDKGFEIKGITNELSDFVYHMGTTLKDGKLVSNGGRVLLVLGKGKTIEEAKEHAYQNVEKITFENMEYRKDIGYKALKGSLYG
jgi:phosphoribosylamine--glycine ligase